MKILGKILVLAALLLGFPLMVLAQRPAASAMATSRPAALPRRVATGRPAPRPFNATSAPATVPPYSNAAWNGWNSSNLLNNNKVPGLGFDYEHLNALSPNLGVEALIDPATQAQLALALRLLHASPQTGFGGGVWALPEPYYEDSGEPAAVPEPDSESAPPPQQPPVIIVQVPGAQAAPEAADSAPAPAAASETDEGGEFILVKRDGTQVDAGAFFHQGNELVYITPSGARRTMPFSDLDVDSTVLANQERGTDLQLPL